MELFRRRAEIPEVDTPICDEVVEVFDQHVNEDGTRLEYSLRKRCGTVVNLAIPRGSLNVLFTTEGPIELQPDTDENH